jgi:protein-L-isoaspartate(D-aspartate) O-methyltransferase
MEDQNPYPLQRERMVREQLIRRDIRDQRVLDAMRSIPRHAFVPPEHRHMAYGDGPLPIGSGQTISQPYIVALMTQLLNLKGDEKVLEVGTGSGYQAAVLAHLAQEVHTIERHANLAEEAGQTLSELGYSNVYVHVGDGTRGWPDAAPYNAIMVTAGSPQVPKSLLAQLDDSGGRMIIPVGGRGNQRLERWYREGDDYRCERILPVAFVPLLGEEGWQE